MEEKIANKLANNLNLTKFQIINQSHLHSSHFYQEQFSGETHFKIIINRSNFDNLSTIQIHRLINKTLQQEFSIGLHALEIKII